MVKIGNDEFYELEANDRHDQIVAALKDIASSARSPEADTRLDDIISVLKAISKRPIPEIDKALSRFADELAGIEKNRNEEVSAIIQKVTDGVAELKTMLDTKPKAFTVERNKLGLIERIVPEY